MSPRAVRITGTSAIEPFQYGQTTGTSVRIVTPPTRPGTAQRVTGDLGVSPRPGVSAAAPPAMPAASEPRRDDEASAREAFAQGYAQGEQAGVEVAARQLAAVHDRLAQTLDQLIGLREELTYRTERHVLDLALAMASRILHREVAADRELLLVMARIALDRMGDVAPATIRLHPDDEAAARGGRDSWPAGAVSVVADPTVRPGGCLIQTAQGHADIGVEAQMRELANALLGEVIAVAQPVAGR